MKILSTSDKIFLSICLMILIGLFWLKFLEDTLSIWFSIPVYILIFWIVFKVLDKLLNRILKAE
jgi:multidrug efflux pump subunit AcrB